MNPVPHIPVLRLGRSYESLEQLEVRDCRSGELRAVVSSVNAGMIRKDLRRIAESRAALNRLPAARLVEAAARAGELFLEGTLPLGDRGHQQSPQDYIATLSATSGLPHIMVRRNMEKIHFALTHMSTVLKGLSRGLDLSILDAGLGEQDGVRLAYSPAGAALGLVMPSNSPAVNSLWLPALPLKTPVVIKPGKEEPWTPYRLIQAFIAAGVPAEAFGFYPTDHEGAGEILRSCGRALIFGDKQTIDKFAGDPAVQVHGPGWSKILIGEDCIDQWPDYLEVMVRSIAENGGRSCINASAIVVPRKGREIAEALARKLGPLQPRPSEAPDARLSAFANPKMAEFIDSQIDEGLKTPGAVDLTAAHREGQRKVEFEGGTYLRPTIIFCESPEHPLFNREFLCPYATVVEVPMADAVARMGYTLALTAITKDEALLSQLMSASSIERLNIGPIPTMQVSWDQPHEGNMFEFLWRRRSLERAW